MGALDTIEVRPFIKLLLAHGLKKQGQTGSHIRYSKPGMLRPLVVATHDKEIKAYLAKQAAKVLGLTPEQLLEELRKY